MMEEGSIYAKVVLAHYAILLWSMVDSPAALSLRGDGGADPWKGKERMD
jgi:hypothetical protein